MKKIFCKVTLDVSFGSAYTYNDNSEIPTVIKFGRYYSGKYQTGKIEGNFNNKKLHEFNYLIKRGYDIEVMNLIERGDNIEVNKDL